MHTFRFSVQCPTLAAMNTMVGYLQFAFDAIDDKDYAFGDGVVRGCCNVRNSYLSSNGQPEEFYVNGTIRTAADHSGYLKSQIEAILAANPTLNTSSSFTRGTLDVSTTSTSEVF